MKKFIFSFLIFSSAFFISGAQDMHFSQFYETPSLLNPAIIGVSGDLRASLQYKNQWSSITTPFKTFSASFEMKFNRKKNANRSVPNLTWGISFFNDQAGDGDMKLTQANFTLCSQVSVGENNFISAGLQGSVAQRGIDYSKLVWPNQYNGSTGYDQNINPGENFSSDHFFYGDFAACLLWTYGKGEMYMTANDEIKANAGVAVFHINRPGQNFLSNSSESLSMRYVFHAGLSYGIKNSSFSVAPGFMLNLQGPSSEMVLGTLFKYQLREDSRYTGYVKSTVVSIGGYYRNQDAIIPTAMVEIGQYAVGVSYDLNISNLSTASNYRGGMEIMLRFTGSNPSLDLNKP